MLEKVTQHVLGVGESNATSPSQMSTIMHADDSIPMSSAPPAAAGRTCPSLESPSYAGWQVTFWHNDPENIVFVCLCLVFVVAPFACALAIQGSHSMRSKLSRFFSCDGYSWDAFRASLKDGLHVELARQPTVTELARQAPAAGTISMQRLLQYAARDVGPFCHVAEGHIRAQYPHDAAEGDRAILLLKMSTALLAFGHCTTDCEKLVMEVARALHTPAAYVSIGHRELKAKFGHGPSHVYCTAGLQPTGQ